MSDFTDKQLELINDWLDGTNHMADLCRMHAMTSGQLSAFMAEDRVIAFITRITSLLELRARHMLALQVQLRFPEHPDLLDKILPLCSPEALETLSTLVITASSAEELRAAALRLIP